MMKANLLLLTVFAALASVAAEVTQVAVTQMWPWSKRVAIDYTVAGCADGETYDVVLTVTDALGRDLTGVTSAQTGDVEDVGNGKHMLTWDPSADATGDAAPMLKYALALRKPVGKKWLVIEFAHGDAYEATRQYTVTQCDELDVSADLATYRQSKMAFRRCRAGTYRMGSPTTETGREGAYPTRGTALKESLHTVTLTKDFYLAVLPTVSSHAWYLWGANTYYTWQTFYSLSSARQIRCAADSSDNWSTNTTVAETSLIGQARKHLLTGLPSGYVLDLPTEAQWEYACRAGTTTAWNDGTDTDYYDTYGQGAYGFPAGEIAAANGSDHNLDALGWYLGHTGLWRQNTPAANINPGQYKPNAWGFYDMHGGVDEFCVDRFTWGTAADGNSEDLGSDAATDPRCTAASAYNIVRGGQAFTLAAGCRSAARTYHGLADNLNNGGFRLAIVPAE